MNKIFKDCVEIWNRLFDHRPFLSGEILYFQEEFEVKRSDREVTRVLKILESISEIRDSEIDKLKHKSESHLPSCEAKLSAALSSCNAILDSESHYNIDLKLSAKRDIRQSEWERFENEMKMKEMNRQLVAVAQFIVSVAAGFAFGFIGVELIVGELDFGFRLLLGIVCALTIALAEIYFLAKILADDIFPPPPVPPSKPHQE